MSTKTFTTLELLTNLGVLMLMLDLKIDLITAQCVVKLIVLL